MVGCEGVVELWVPMVVGGTGCPLCGATRGTRRGPHPSCEGRISAVCVMEVCNCVRRNAQLRSEYGHPKARLVIG